MFAETGVERMDECLKTDYMGCLCVSSGEKDIIFVGDFNLGPDSEGEVLTRGEGNEIF